MRHVEEFPSEGAQDTRLQRLIMQVLTLVLVISTLDLLAFLAIKQGYAGSLSQD